MQRKITVTLTELHDPARRITAIRFLRGLANIDGRSCPLREAKDAIDALAAHRRPVVVEALPNGVVGEASGLSTLISMAARTAGVDVTIQPVVEPEASIFAPPLDSFGR